MGKLILVYGASSSGKSSIKKQLEIIAPYLISEDEDEAHEAYAVELMARYSSSNYLILSESMSIHDIFVAVLHSGESLRIKGKISNKQIAACNFFQKNWSDIIKFKDPNFALFRMFQQVIEKVKNGKKGIIFTSNTQLFESYKHTLGKNIEIIYIFIYCPFKELCRRIIERNTTSDNKANYRIGLFPIIQFLGYLKYRDSYQSTLIDKISLLTLSQSLKDVVDSFGHINCNDINLEEITKKFGFIGNNPNQTIEYTISTFCDHIINSQISSPLESANYIDKLIRG